MKLLKLTGIQSYIGNLTATGDGAECAKVEKGQVVIFDDEAAETVMDDTRARPNKEGEMVAFFTDVSGSYVGPVAFDFRATVKSGAEKKAKHTSDVGIGEPGEGMENDTQPGAAARTTAARRSPRTKAQ